MKQLLLSLLIFGFGISGLLGQTIKSLGYNTTNGQVVYSGTNTLTFTNGTTAFNEVNVTNELTLGGVNGVIFFADLDGAQDIFVFDNGVGGADEARARTNLGLGLPALTNTNVTNFRSAIGVAAAPIFKALTNDFSITNQTNMTVVDGLTISTEAGKAYIFELFPILTASSLLTDLQIVASNATIYGQWDSFGTAGFGTNALTNIISLGIGSDSRILKQTFYVTTGTNAGSILLQFRSTAATNTNTVRAGSYMTAQEVAPAP